MRGVKRGLATWLATPAPSYRSPLSTSKEPVPMSLSRTSFLALLLASAACAGPYADFKDDA